MQERAQLLYDFQLIMAFVKEKASSHEPIIVQSDNNCLGAVSSDIQMERLNEIEEAITTLLE